MGADVVDTNLPETNGADMPADYAHAVAQAQRRVLTVRNVNCYAAAAYCLLVAVLGAMAATGLAEYIRSLWSSLVAMCVVLFVHVMVIRGQAQEAIRKLAYANIPMGDVTGGVEWNPQDQRKPPFGMRAVLGAIASLFDGGATVALIAVDALALVAYLWQMFRMPPTYYAEFKPEVTDWYHLARTAQYGAKVLFTVVMLVFPNCLMLCITSPNGCRQSIRHNMGKAVLAASGVVLAAMAVVGLLAVTVPDLFKTP